MKNVHLNRRFFDQIAVMFGREARKPTQISERAQEIHILKRATNKERLQQATVDHEKSAKGTPGATGAGRC
jgi:hypothetical protein